MSRVVDFREGRLRMAAKRGFRNWASRFKENFGLETRFSEISMKTLSYLAEGKEKATFYFYDLIMELEGMGSGFEFNELSPAKKMAVIDRYLFLLDRVRFECMKRLGWVENYPGENHTLVELVVEFDQKAAGLQAKVPLLSRTHPRYEEFSRLNVFDQESLIRKMIPTLLKEIRYYSNTL